MAKMAGSGVSSEVEDAPFLPGAKKTVKEEEPVVEKTVKEYVTEITAPMHLWNLGAVKITTTFRTSSEVAAFIGQCQELWRNLEDAHAERISEVDAIRNRITPAQLEYVVDLAEQTRTELPENLQEVSQTEAKHLIKDMLSAKGEKEPARRGGGRYSGRSSYPRRNDDEETSRRSGGRTSSYRRSGSSRKRGGEYDNDAKGGVTPGQLRYLRRLYGDVRRDEPEDLEDMSFNQASETIQKLEDEANR